VVKKILKDFGFNTDNRVYIAAEIGINHGGSLSLAKKMIDSASRTGCDAVKFQTYLTEKRVKKDSPIFGILKECELAFDAFRELKAYAEDKKLAFFSTPFDTESLLYLETIDCPVYKVASFDIVNHKLLKAVASTGKPVVMSTGMSAGEEIQAAYDIVKKGTDKISLLHCVSSYPCKEADCDLDSIQALKEAFDCLIGYSDHTDGINTSVLAVACGAQVLEKHYKIDLDMKCADGPISITEDQMKLLVQTVRKTEAILGQGQLLMRSQEKQFAWLRRNEK